MSNIVLSQDQKQAVEMVRVLFPHLKDVPDVEVAKGIATARHLGLDPIRRECHLVPFKNSVQIVISYLEYIKRAERSGRLAGWEVQVGKDGLGEFAEVVIHRKDWTYPFRWRVYLQEAQKNTPSWQQQPLFMLRKVAIAQGFRLAFPEELSHMPYTEEEISPQEIPIQAQETSEEQEPQEQAKPVRMITDAQLRKLKAQLKELGITDREEARELIVSIIGREVESSKDLTIEEASQVISALEEEIKVRQEERE
ncbi:RecT family recombinase [Hydrogenobacter thermophilus]|uniref:RecT family recombinase n=1 Tax=Hydrogenobacter thermophilus TaxID=940 RepID=UPI0030F84ECC